MQNLISVHLRANLVLIVCTVIWGGTFAVIKSSLEFVSPLFFVSVRFFIAALIVLPFVLLFREWRRQTFFDREIAVNGLILAAFMTVGFGFQTAGLNYTTASRSAFITELLVIFTPPLQYMLYKRKPHAGNYLGILLILPGMYLLTSPGTTGINAGDILTLVCAGGFALYIVYLDHFSRKHAVVPLLFWQLSGASLFSLIAALFTEEISFTWNASVFTSLLYLSLIASIAVLYLQTRFQKDTTPVQAGILYSMEPVFATVFAVILLNESLTLPFYAGAGLILFGVLVSGAVNDETDWYRRFH